MTSEKSDSETSKGGLLNSTKNLISTLLAMGQTRLELLSTEIEEERVWLSSMLIWTLVALSCAALSVIMITILVVVVFWDTYRLTAISVMITLFILAAFFAWRTVYVMSKRKPRLFASSIAELAKDRKQLAERDE